MSVGMNIVAKAANAPTIAKALLRPAISLVTLAIYETVLIEARAPMAALNPSAVSEYPLS